MPKDAEFQYCGQWYKRGRFGRLYVWRDEWKRSSADESSLNRMIVRKQNHYYDSYSSCQSSLECEAFLAHLDGHAPVIGGHDV